MREQYDEAELDREGAGLTIVGVVGMVLSCFHWAQQCRQEHWYGIQNFRPFGGIFLCHEGAMGHFYTIRVLAQSLTVLDLIHALILWWVSVKLCGEYVSALPWASCDGRATAKPPHSEDCSLAVERGLRLEC